MAERETENHRLPPTPMFKSTQVAQPDLEYNAMKDHIQPVRLLPELVDKIIDHLYNDKHTLSSCSLVSKSWLPASHYHLLSKVSVDGKRKTFHRFQESLESYPGLCRYLNDLSFGEKDIELEQSEFPVLHLHVLSSILSKLSSLRNMYIFGVRFEIGDQSFDAGSVDLVMDSLTLTLFPAQSNTLVVLRDVLSSFRSLDYLCIQSPSQHVDSTTLVPSTPISRLVQASHLLFTMLNVPDSVYSTIVSSLFDSLDPASLRSFFTLLDDVHPEYTRTHMLGTCISKTAPTSGLERLRLGIKLNPGFSRELISFILLSDIGLKSPQLPATKHTWTTLNLSKLLSLSTICLYWLPHGRPEPRDLTTSEYQQGFDSLPHLPRTLRMITCQVHKYSLDESSINALRDLDLERVDKELSKFPALKRFAIEFIIFMDFALERQLRELLISKLPTLHQRGILRIWLDLPPVKP